jgi:phosphatidylserine/phosphatidylglycerophosphate/cardiolipin synthase-like enzyme
MRFKSPNTDGYTVYAVTGINSVSFAVDSTEANTEGLLGFSVERFDPEEDQRFYMYNLKVFKEIVPKPTPYMKILSYDHPIQSMVWDDFTAKPGREYIYFFHPVKGKPKHLDRSAKPISITVKTEIKTDDTKTEEHEIYFNRGVASSQAYAREFDRKRPDELEGDEQKRAYAWLSRGLDDAIIRFIDQAKQGDELKAALYEFRHLPVAQAFEAAIDRGVKVKIIYDAKVNESTDKKGNFHESFPREANIRITREAKIPKNNLIRREANEDHIHHNKFIVLIHKKKPTAVWTGSTNISEGGIYGQTNVGHWLRNPEVAEAFSKYWDLLSTDPGAQPGDERGKRTKDNNAFREKVSELSPDIDIESIDDIPDGITPIFSPRNSINMLQSYARMVDNANRSACITLAFGVNAEFKDLLQDNTKDNQIVFLLLEKKDAPNPKSNKPFVKLGAFNNVYESFGDYLNDPLYQWTHETNTRKLKLNEHVAYIHSKFLLMDPLGETPVVVSGSANFSDASTRQNDENMLIIKGNRRVADIYFTEFMRLFNHYYFRSVYNETKTERPEEIKNDTAFLCTDDSWLEKYAPGKLRNKRVKMFAEMQID